MLKRLYYVVIGVCALQLLTACQSDKQNTSSLSEEDTQHVEYFADNGTGNPLAIVQHPAGEYHNGITYVSYQGPFEDPYVAAYHHETQSWTGPFRAGTSELGRRKGRTKFDNHGKPTLLIDDLGYVHIFYGGHGGDYHHGENKLGNVHHGANKHSISKRPLDITEWDEVDNISVFGTYNQAMKMDNGHIYLFYRHGAHRSDWVYQKSIDHGRTFDAPVSFLKHKRRDDLKAVDSWYAWVGKGQGNDIIVSFDYHLCWDTDATPRGHTTERHDAYFMIFDTDKGTWRNVQGESLAMPLTREMADQKTLVLDTGNDWTFNGSSALDANGHPHIAINVGEDLGKKTGGPKLTRHLRWNGTEWVGNNTINGLNSGQSRGDFIISSSGEIQYILADDSGVDGVVALWNSENGGQSFIKEKELLRVANSGLSITSLIKNAHPDAQVLVAQKERGDANRKIYLIGQNGPIPRALTEATLPKDTSEFAKK